MVNRLMSNFSPTGRPRDFLSRAGGWLVRVCQAVLVLLPVVLAWRLAKRYRVNVLHLDDWAYVPLYEKAVNGGLTWHDFFAGYLEHRPAVARVIAIVTTVLSNGDVRWQCVVAFAAITLTWVNCGLLLRRALGGWRSFWLPWSLMGWVMFCPVQWQEFLWPSCHMDTLPLFFLTSAMLVLGAERLPLWLRLAFCAAFAWSATYSFAAGLTLWVLVPLAVGCGYGVPEVAARKRFLFTWLVPMGIVLFCYFYDLKNEEARAFAYGQGNVDTMTHSVAAVLQAPEKGIKFTLTLLGTNFARGIFGERGPVALAMGMAGAGVFALGLAALLRRWKQFGARRAALPMALIAFYGMSVAGMVASGRAWASKDVGGALNNRYACFASAFVAGLVGLVGVGAGLRRNPSASGGNSGGKPVAEEGDGNELAEGGAPRWLAISARPLGGVLCGLMVANWCYGAHMMASWHYARTRGAVDIHFSRLLGPAQDRGQDMLNIHLAHERAVVMDKLGFLGTPLAKTLDLKQFRIRDEELEARLGRVTGTVLEPETITINGYAMLATSGRTADGILITCNDGSERGPQIVEAVMPDNLPAFYLNSTLKDLQYILLDDDRPRRHGGWSARIRRDALPKGGDLRIEAWALSYEGMSVKRIGDGFTIRN
jgi:hypothetical protein